MPSPKLAPYYQQHGGYINYQGVPYTCCYHPGPDPGYSITIPAPKPILRPVLKKFTLGLLPNSFTALIDSPGGETQITPPGVWGPWIWINVPGDIGPQILITPPGDTGPLDIKDPPAEYGPSILINNPPDLSWLTRIAKAEGADDEKPQPPPSPKVSEVLKGKKGSIQRAPLDPGSPSWDDIRDMTMAEVRAAANANIPGFKTMYKLLNDRRFNK